MRAVAVLLLLPALAAATGGLDVEVNFTSGAYRVVLNGETWLRSGQLRAHLNGEWHAVTPQPGTFVVNIGDLYEIWTNGRWRSTVHRVMKPPAGSAAVLKPRLSLPFFTGPDNDAIIEAMPTCVDENRPAKYKPVKALDHLLRKLAESNVYTAKD